MNTEVQELKNKISELEEKLENYISLMKKNLETIKQEIY